MKTCYGNLIVYNKDNLTLTYLRPLSWNNLQDRPIFFRDIVRRLCELHTMSGTLTLIVLSATAARADKPTLTVRRAS